MTGQRRPVRTIQPGEMVFISHEHNGKLAEADHHLKGAVPARVGSVTGYGNDVFALALDLPTDYRNVTYLLAGGVQVVVW